MSNSFKIRPTHFSWGGENFSKVGFSSPGYGPVDFYNHKKLTFSCVLYAHSQFLCSLAKFDLANQVCAPASPAAYLQYTTARIWRDLSAASFCSCKLLWRSGECVSLPCFNTQPDIFAVTNCCVVALSLFFSDNLTWSADSLYSVQWYKKLRGVDVEKYAYYVNKLLQNVGLETWKWRQIVT